MAFEKAASPFPSERDAKEYLIARIVTEAQSEGIALSELELKMLYFSETGWTLPNILEVNAEFEREYDNDEYEQKIAGLVREIEKQNEIAGGEEQSRWDNAVAKLSEGDHYLLVLIDLGHSSPLRGFSNWLPAGDFYGAGKVRPPGDFLRLVIVGLAFAFTAFAAAVIKSCLKK